MLKLKAKVGDSYIARLTGKPDQPRFTSKWQLIGKSQWCCSAKFRPPLDVLTNNWTRGKQPENTPPLQSTTPRKSIHHMAPPQRTSDCSLLLICRPRKDERLSLYIPLAGTPTHEGMARLSWPGWLVTYWDKCAALGFEPGHGHPF